MNKFHRSIAGVATVGALVFSVAAHAQGAAPIDAEKQKLIDRLLTLWHPENEVIIQAQRVGTNALEQASLGLQGRVSKARQDQAMKDIGTDVQKYIDTATPLVSASAKKQVNPSVGPLLATNFSTEELRQIIAMLENPVKGKFEKLVPDMERAVGEKVSADVGPALNKEITTLKTNVGLKMRAAAAGN
jgi:hypothetical protein